MPRQRQGPDSHHPGRAEAGGGFVREIKIQNLEYKPMHVEEAVLQMDLTEESFLVVTNSRSEHINVLYRRKDGHLGLIEPES